MKYLKTKVCKICKKKGKVYLFGNRTKYRIYICDNCKSCYSEKKQTKEMTDEMTDFNLSERRCECADMMYPEVVYSEEDVKEFITEIKLMVAFLPMDNEMYKEFLFKIDKLAGDKLK